MIIITWKYTYIVFRIELVPWKSSKMSHQFLKKKNNKNVNTINKKQIEIKIVLGHCHNHVFYNITQVKKKLYVFQWLRFLFRTTCIIIIVNGIFVCAYTWFLNLLYTFKSCILSLKSSVFQYCPIYIYIQYQYESERNDLFLSLYRKIATGGASLYIYNI